MAFGKATGEQRGARGLWGYRIRNWACPPQLTGTRLALCHTPLPAFSPGPQTSVFCGGDPLAPQETTSTSM